MLEIGQILERKDTELISYLRVLRIDDERITGTLIYSSSKGININIEVNFPKEYVLRGKPDCFINPFVPSTISSDKFDTLIYLNKDE